MRKFLSFGAGAVAASLLLAAGGGANATPFFFNASGTCSEACAANAEITPGAGTLTVVLTDSQANPRSAGDLLSNLEITPSGSVGSASLFSQAGSLITVTSTTGPYTISPGPPTHWEASTSGTEIVLDVFSGATPINMIIGPPDGSGNYSNSNSSINDGHFSPYINGTGTFVIDDSAITADTTITDVTFSFGTSLNEHTLPGSVCTPGTPNCSSGPPILTPEPSALALFGGALVVFGMMWRRRSV
jgi:PEP-CTERM motif-containing protein